MWGTVGGQAHTRERNVLALSTVLACMLLAWRPGAPGGGVMMIGLTGAERELFRKGLEAFEAVSSVPGDGIVPQTEAGLGPRFNLDSCAGCHAHPFLTESWPIVLAF